MQRLEKLVEMSKGMLPTDGMSQGMGDGNSFSGAAVIQEENENLEVTDGFATPYGKRAGDLGLNPANYANIEDEV